MTVIPDHEHEHLKLRRIASVLLPGDDTSPPATSVPDYDELLSKAVEVIGAEQPMLTRALEQLPDDADWDALKEFADNEPDGFRSRGRGGLRRLLHVDHGPGWHCHVVELAATGRIRE